MSDAVPLITLDPDVLAGKPIVAGTRISVELVLDLIAASWSEADILADYPTLDREKILACMAYARNLVASERVYPSAARDSSRTRTSQPKPPASCEKRGWTSQSSSAARRTSQCWRAPFAKSEFC